ncbi:hypothetical protein MIR68_011941 [Amoeboaphelidium protococcarum]|nr:hypothetical protein MIR68_011941 [Amoeboaphelidium protococcarum]
MLKQYQQGAYNQVRFLHQRVNNLTSKSSRFTLQKLTVDRSDNVIRNDYKTVKNQVKAGSFNDFGLRSDIMSAVDSMGLKKPTAIQILAIPEILKRRNVLLAAETSSGKTLTYLLPLINQLKQQEEVDGFLRLIRRPRVLIVVPSKELVHQVTQTVKQVGHHAKIRVESILDRKPQKKRDFDGCFDIVVTTPIKLKYYLQDKMIQLNDLQCLVVDEADTMMDKDFAVDIKSLIDSIKANDTRKKCQFIFSSATIPKALDKQLDDEFGDDILKIASPRLHKTVPALRQRFIHLDGHGDNKQQTLLRVLTELPPKDCPTLIFCNTLASCRSLQSWLSSHDVFTDLNGGADKMQSIHSKVERDDRFMAIKQFEQGALNTLICTDIASRGINTLAARHVIMYDFPQSAADYLHRVGRTARLTPSIRQEGKATALVSRRDRQLASEIETLIKRKAALA